ncbi:kinase-like protein [Cenococcum geophilum 1.58]|uniref:kinase-like protein n=1 Tax=Cenococcum geophilum 1.58 TaxID=794803 RepID=UPI00358F7C19|nr:kinase-like protein [Cenococcum geophilum 1.58]
MPRPNPHPSTLFSLIPVNNQAQAVLTHPNNSHLVSLIPNLPESEYPKGVQCGLNIGFHIGSKSRYTLATLGRNGADITVEGPNISRIHCAFEIHKDSCLVMLYDRSITKSTQPYGANAIPFELERNPRRIVVTETVNQAFGFGGITCDLVQFRIHWHHDPNQLNIQERLSHREDHPCFARTLDETPIVPPSGPVTENTPRNQEPKIRYMRGIRLGGGSYGQVWRITNVDSGEILAVKRVKLPEQGLQSSAYTMLKREVEALARVSHANIVEYISAQGWTEEYLEIFTKLKEGSVQDLINKGLFIRDPSSVDSLLHQMLQALDYLAYNGMVHRDVKPENILYTSLPHGGYTFQLTDFGLCNVVSDARTYAGTPVYMAPEVLCNLEIKQTPKVDVWSLFVTITYVMNAGGYRDKPLHTNEQKIKAVLEAANDKLLQPIQLMAMVNPDRRASAAKMLNDIFHGKGLTTPRN